MKLRRRNGRLCKPKGLKVPEKISGPDAEWTWMDEDGLVHGSGRHRDKNGTVFSTGTIACFDSNAPRDFDAPNGSICDYLRCIEPITCVACIAARAGFGRPLL